MHLLVDEVLTAEQLQSPMRYIYEVCEMYGWELPTITECDNTYHLQYSESSDGKARKRHRLIHDASVRLKFNLIDNTIIDDDGRYYVNATVPKYKN